MTEEARSLITMRLQQAEEALVDAALLAERAHWRGALNRAYYAIFYAGQAVLGCKQIKSHKHSGALAMFDLHVVKQGEFPVELAKAFRHAFHLRNKYDYKELAPPKADQAQACIDQARHFIDKAKEVCQPYLHDAS